MKRLTSPLFKITYWVMLLLFGCGVIGTMPATATIDAYAFEHPEQEVQYRQLIQELRCPKCQNQNVADSNAMIAEDIKDRVYEWVQAGHSSDEITQFLVDRYGDFVTYRPPFRASTVVLWTAPPLLLVLLFVTIVWRVKRAQHRTTAQVSHQEAPEASQQDDALAVAKLLSQLKKDQ